MSYYAVWGTNGVGVCDEWRRVEQSRGFLKQVNTKKFREFDDAVRYALDQFNKLKQIDEENFDGPLPLNLILYREHRAVIRKGNVPAGKMLKYKYESAEKKYYFYYMDEEEKIYLNR